MYRGCVHTYVLDRAEIIFVEDKKFQCEAVTRSVFEEVVREICDMVEVETCVLQVFSPLCEPSPRKIPTQTLHHQEICLSSGSTTTPPSFVKCYVILFNEIYI